MVAPLLILGSHSPMPSQRFQRGWSFLAAACLLSVGGCDTSTGLVPAAVWDRWDTSEWAVRVRDYINNESANAEYIPEWFEASPPLSTEQAWDREACVADEKYIFFSRRTI